MQKHRPIQIYQIPATVLYFYNFFLCGPCWPRRLRTATNNSPWTAAVTTTAILRMRTTGCDRNTVVIQTHHDKTQFNNYCSLFVTQKFRNSCSLCVSGSLSLLYLTVGVCGGERGKHLDPGWIFFSPCFVCECVGVYIRLVKCSTEKNNPQEKEPK